MESLAFALVIGATLCWGLAQVIGKFALRDIGSLFFNTVRFTVAAAIITVGVVSFGSLGGMELGYPLLSAISSGALAWFLATLLLFYVLKRDAAHRIIPAGNSYPFWAILFSAMLLNERITLLIPISTVLVFGGTYLLSRRREGEGEGWKFGVPLASLVGFIWGVNAVLNKFSLDGGMSRSSLIWVRIVTAVSIYWMFFILRNGRRIPEFDGRSLGLSALSGSIAFPLGSTCYIWALSMEEASALAPITGATVFFGFIFSVIILGEKPTRAAILGMLAILAGIVLMAF